MYMLACYHNYNKKNCVFLSTYGTLKLHCSQYLSLTTLLAKPFFLTTIQMNKQVMLSK